MLFLLVAWPAQISTLQFEQIVSAHKKYYHPQNALLFLYGDIDFKKALSTIDKQFLNHFTKNKHFKAPHIPLQKDSSHYSNPSLVNVDYPGPKGPNKDFLAKGYVLGPLSLLEEDALAVILRAFAYNPVAPLKLRILKEGLATSVFVQRGSGQDNAWSFIFQGTESAKREKIENVLQEEIDKVIQQGLDQKILNSVFNQWEFSNREEKNQSHKALGISFLVRSHWLNTQRHSLAEELDFAERLKKIREVFNDTNFVKKFFKKNFKDNNRFRWLVMKPDPKFSEKLHNKIEKQITKALKQKPLSEYEKEDKLFRQWVAKKEAPEITNKIPLLKLSDIKADEKPIPFYHSKIDSYQLREYPLSTNGISYIQLFFDLKGVKEEDLNNLNLFIKLLKKTDNKNYPFQELSKQIQTYFGEISFNITSYQSAKNPEQFKPLMQISVSFLNRYQEKSMALLKELLLNSLFSPKERSQNLLDEMKTFISHNISQKASLLSKISSTKHFFPSLGAFEDEIHGGLFLKYILKSQMNSHQIVPKLKLLLKDIFNQKRLYLISSVAEQEQLKSLRAEFKKLKKALPNQSTKDQKWLFSNQKNYSAYAIPGTVQYLTEVLNFREQGLKYTGHLKVYSQYLGTHFMIPRLREQAGAYGAWSYPNRSGLWFLRTYRDPHLKNSFSAFSQTVDFMKEEKLTTEKLKPAILGALKTYYQDRSVSSKANQMTNLYLADLSWDDYIQTKREILNTHPEDFHPINQALAHALKKSGKAVTGNADKIKKETPDFKEVLTLP